MNTLKIFLASSEELKYERLLIAELVTKLNYIWYEDGVSIRLVKWEYLDSSMSIQHKQEDYNDELRQCDACIVLFWKKCGLYTKQEFDTACQLLNSDSNLVQLGVLFKECSEITDELQCFKDSIDISYSELCYTFTHDEQLQVLFIKQLLRCIQSKFETRYDKNAKWEHLRVSLTKREYILPKLIKFIQNI